MTKPKPRNPHYYVAPYTGAWIEIMFWLLAQGIGCVAPYTGAWIEIFGTGSHGIKIKSLPTRERGLKSVESIKKGDPLRVAPYTGAWIEIQTLFWLGWRDSSLPTRERGLKYLTFTS